VLSGGYGLFVGNSGFIIPVRWGGSTTAAPPQFAPTLIPDSLLLVPLLQYTTVW